jgi:hypothetical protein
MPIMRLPAGLRALAHRNFRLYFFGQSVSILGSTLRALYSLKNRFSTTHSALKSSRKQLG